MTKQEIKKIREMELEKWNSYIFEANNGADKEWIDKKRFYWCGVYEILSELGLEPIRDERRNYLTSCK